MDEARTIVAGNGMHRPLMDYQISIEDWVKSVVELNEMTATMAESLRRFRQRLAAETEFRPRTDPGYLICFLRVRKYNLQRAYELLKDHYRFRSDNPDVFPDPFTLREILRANIFNYLPHRDHMGRAVFVVKMRNWNVHQVPFQSFVAAGNIVSEYVLDNPVTQINGYIGIWDFSGFSFRQLITFVKQSNVMLLVRLMQAIFPGRLKVAYCINCYSLVETAWNVFKVALLEKFRNRVVILGSNMNDLHQYVDPCILPIEYGGSRPSWPSDEIADRVMANEEYFNYNRSFGY